MEDFSLCLKQFFSHLLAACLWVLRIFENLYFASTERVAIDSDSRSLDLVGRIVNMVYK